MKKNFLALLLSVFAINVAAQKQIQFDDAMRFVELWKMTDGEPTAEQLQSMYIAPGSDGLKFFTPNRIQNSENLYETVKAAPELYETAITRCLPWAKQTQPILDETYARFSELLPERDLPDIYILFGAGNSGGTVGEGAQIIGIEVICEISKDRQQFMQTMRHFYAHETVHTWQNQSETVWLKDPLLVASLHEGAADFLSLLVTGEYPHPDRHKWAKDREKALWEEFQNDRKTVKLLIVDSEKLFQQDGAYKQWLNNYKSTKDGRPYELGYWMGMRILESYYQKQKDKSEALESILKMEDPWQILAESGYGAD